jgi:hypothetical protein
MIIKPAERRILNNKPDEKNSENAGISKNSPVM